MKIIENNNKISIIELKLMAESMFGDLVKAVVDIDSMINLRPSWGNRSRGVDDEETRAKIVLLVKNKVE